ncbi:SRPBCC domain-containing protein [Microbacterium sp. HD4P20]|uniref:SRPBCC family protein n=1 Tax=Microbacterium sp. HD4P20 TaxID=2864874 RepID=UPI001C6404EC|nr:SRPBCC domain-containing protein [Microbacterium sp. HD4P20]MCP2637177.1 SRPBCC domain-containing protein [Microbacterium sp. HD4P20]
MLELTEEALVAASVDAVWADLTESERLAAWIWPPNFETTAVVELLELGRWQVRSESAGLAIEAAVLTYDAPESLRLAWRWAGEEHSTDVEFTLARAAGGATRVVVRHSGFLSADDRASHVEGWSHCLQRLVDRYGGAPGEHL